MRSCLCQSMHCSMMFLKAKIWSVHPLFFLNPGCSFLSSGSTASDIRLMMILPLMILLENDKKVIPYHLLQSIRIHFLRISTVTSSFQSSGTFFPSHTAVKRRLWVEYGPLQITHRFLALCFDIIMLTDETHCKSNF